MRTVILVDGKNFAFRHGFKHAGLSSKGRPTGMLYGVLSGLCRLNRYFPGAAFVFCWDGKDTRKSWRNKLYPAYKANRNKGGSPPSWVKAINIQIPLFKKFLDLMGFLQLEIDTLEADDLVGLISERIRRKIKVAKVVIYTMDRDMYQLIGDNVSVVNDTDKKANCKPVDPKNIKERFGVYPKDWLKFRALVGDKGDNIPKAAKKLGPKTAAKLVAAGFDITASKPKKNKVTKKYLGCWENAKLSYRLSRILLDYNDKELDKTTRSQVKKLLQGIKKYRHLRRKVNDKQYSKMVKFLGEYEMEELIRRRKDLWSIK